MRFVVLLLASIALTAVAKAQNVVYDENAEIRSVGAFTGIDVSGTVSLYLAQGSVAGVAVSAGDQKYNSKIKTEVKNGILQISVDGGMWNGFNWTNRKLKAYVTVTDLTNLEVSGASYLTTISPIKSGSLKIDLSGASEIKGEFEVANLNMDISGASVAKLTGSATEGLVSASGAAKLNGYEFKISKCKASSSGASVVRLTVVNELNADASGGSVIHYKGSPSTKTLNASSASSINNKGGGDD